MASVAHIIRRRRRRRSERKHLRAQKQRWTGLSAVLVIALILGPLSVIFGSVAVVYARAMSALPDPQATIYLDPVLGPTELYDSAGGTLLFAVQDPLGDGRAWLTLDEIPEFVAQATILWEDPNFPATAGFNPFTALSRLWHNWLEGPVDIPHSLTLRLVRNVIAPAGDFVTADNRALEIALVTEINRLYAPDTVLEWHLNTNYYGNEAYGIEAAAQVYLGKSARDLTLDEAALLATIPTEPRLNPVDNETAARGRQADILRQMLAAGTITRSQFEGAINAQTALRPGAGQTPLVAPEFALYARRQAESILTAAGHDGERLITRGGLRITTTLDIDLYFQAECILRAHVARLAGDSDPQITAQGGRPCSGMAYLQPISAAQGGSPPDSGIIVILDAASGEIRAMTGPGTRTTYQPGPTLYPFIYLDGFIPRSSQNYTAATMLLDIPRSFPGVADGLLYIPNNPDGEFRGPVSLREAMGAGLLPPVTHVANALNLNNVLRRTAHPLGINSLRDGTYDLSLLERGGTVSVLDVTYSYAVFAAMGQANGLRVPPLAPGLRTHDPVAVKRIEDADGNILWEYDETQIVLNRAPLLQSELAYLVNDILADRATRWSTLGQSNVLELPRRAAVVNGLTGDRVSNWTVGYTPQIVTGVHLARGGGGEMSLDAFGMNGAATVWRAVMEYAHARDNLPDANWPRPQNIAQMQVCEISGMTPNGACPTRDEIFLDRRQFPPQDTYWQRVEVNSETGQLATVNTPAALRRTSNYFVPPQDALDWWRANNRPLPPTQHDTVSRPDILSSAVILQPGNYEIVGGVVDVRGSMDTNNMAFYQISYGQGPNPDRWTDITGQVETFMPGTSLAMWNTAGLDGTYVLRLTAVLQDGTLETGTAQVIVDNIPPTIVLTAGEPGQVFRWPEDGVIPVVAEVSDNIRIDRVEFYHNGQFIGIANSYPFGYDHTINRTGVEVFTAVVFDAVGNSSSAEIQVEVTRAGG
jgi:membrane peptidoglycan carboxypeptidase